MGCCVSSPHSRRVYLDPGDLDEEIVPLRYFSANRPGSVHVPDDIVGLSSTWMQQHLATDQSLPLYQAEIDQGTAFRGLRPFSACILSPWGLAFCLTQLGNACRFCPCDLTVCWLRKEYSTRTWLHIYSNRIEVNEPQVRIPFGICGCGSWNSDNVVTHPFDRGAFGFRYVPSGIFNYLLCLWPLYGGVMARQRCQCNGPVWNRMFTDCGGWWCDEWLCQVLFCSYRYYGLADAEEVAFVSSICLQAYYEGRELTQEDVQKCIHYWRQNLSEAGGGPERPVCCEPYCKVPLMNCSFCYKYLCHPRRRIPYRGEKVSEELKEVYKDYNKLCKKQVKRYNEYTAPVRSSTVCRRGGCKRFFGRNGCCFCTEGCNHCCDRKAGDPAPPFDHRDIDDENDASVVLRKVLGDPPDNVVYKRWRINEDCEQVLEVRCSERAKLALQTEETDKLELLAN
uniref:Uncharacterized protein n=1 Tax=Grammatophora oceanica TaxID=210454 RepID=A0A7S1VK42_9STRA|mmetsp:Transcript_47467/g.70646  ORF Transcript_47467/g.70646 Transcript_47467/m.70646 type:complete len:452 (+) Transcript_47467:145-1500(+)